MRQFFSFWWLCARRAAAGNSAHANDWQWLFANPVWQSIGSAVGAALGAWVSAHWREAPVMSPDTPIGVFLGGLFGFCATWIAFFLIRFIHAPAALYHEKSATSGAAIETVVRDVPLYDAICRMFFGRWQKIPIIDGHLDLSASAFQSIHDLIAQVKQLAFDGRLPIWGKAQGHLAMWEQPKPAFWNNHQIDYYSFTDGDPTKLRVVPHNTSGQITSLRDLMTSRAAIEKICRDPSVNLPTNDANSLVVFTGKGEPFDKIEVNQHGIHRTIFIGVKNVGSKKVSNCNFYRVYVAHNNDSKKTHLDGPFSLDPNETRYISVAMFNETKGPPNIEHLIGLSSNPAAFGAGIAPVARPGSVET